MGQALNTTVNGSSGTCVEAADWHDKLAKAAHDAGGEVAAARTTSESDWSGPASHAFQDSIRTVDRTAHDLGDTATAYAEALREFAATLDSVNRQMQSAITKAIGGGLEVDGPIILAPTKPNVPRPGPGQVVHGPDGAGVVMSEYRADLDAYYAAQAAYNRKIAVYNECKAIVEEARRAEGNAHHTLAAALSPPAGSQWDDLDSWSIGNTVASRVVGYVSSFENPRKEALMHAQRLGVEANFYRRWANGMVSDLDDWQLKALREAGEKAGAGQADYLKRAKEYERYIKTVPQWARTVAAAYPGRELVHALPDDAGAGLRAAQKGLKALPYAGSTLTVINEFSGAMKGEQSWGKAGVDAAANIAGGYLGAVGATAAVSAAYGSPLGPIGALVTGTVGGIVGVIGGQAVADFVVPK
ncbi:hypothetical protein [Amycolatopsis cihanbeyliensis]|uniref:Uncharacterized protein n=1 Tax=Amycolatopsis cihanbeyliensis TaxID=1128664 RepID=A0A542DPN7_AMYCI|nr:hypothetical protein [Amycolatopsis cihanbeyliensis]TQJ05078.1 hypothetical protein FB471_4901 [Amycolatopsis cihanbeyliensis]